MGQTLSEWFLRANVQSQFDHLAEFGRDLRGRYRGRTRSWPHRRRSAVHSASRTPVVSTRA